MMDKLLNIKNKSAVTRLICTVCVPFLPSSCVMDELHDTPHPDKGVAAVEIILPQGMSQDDYTVEIDGMTAAMRKGRYIVSDPLPSGEYTVLAYNRPEGITVTDGIARVRRVGGTHASTDFTDPLPGYLYSGTERITVVADDTLRMSLGVAQRVRDLHIGLTVTEGDPERIAAVTGTLSGVAEACDLRNETLCGEAVSTCPAFTRSGGNLSADLRLLGITGDVQTLSVTLTFTDGMSQTVDSDLTEVLAGFNGDMKQPFTVSGNLATPTGTNTGGCTITDWQHGGGGSGNAE